MAVAAALAFFAAGSAVLVDDSELMSGLVEEILKKTNCTEKSRAGARFSGIFL